MRNAKNIVLGVRMYASISKVAFDGQITIPAEIRRKKKIEAGCDLLFIDVEGAIIIKKMDESKKTFDVFDERTKELNLSFSELNDLVELEKQHTWDGKYAKGDD
jgi:AbrB family looped-hinge helix DNA binding protein